jgi:uncharacterized protein
VRDRIFLGRRGKIVIERRSEGSRILSTRMNTRMRAAIVTGLLLAVCGFAQDYPKPNGFVNDFANQLPLEAVQSLEMKVRDYQRATGNQIGVAVVPSLNGTSIGEYSLGLFRAWGVGQYGLNNGVLFVWAPKERQIHIEVGRGLGSALNQAERERILAQVRTLFRELKYEEGVNAAVDGVIGVLGRDLRGRDLRATRRRSRYRSRSRRRSPNSAR